jgi:hypothetical protein
MYPHPAPTITARRVNAIAPHLRFLDIHIMLAPSPQMPCSLAAGYLKHIWNIGSLKAENGGCCRKENLLVHLLSAYTNSEMPWNYF